MSQTSPSGPATSRQGQTEERNLYQVLQVDPQASREIISEAYWVLVRKARSQSEDHTAGEVLRQLNVAYATLVNPDLRLAYSRTLPPGRSGGAPSVPGDVRGRRRPVRRRLLGPRHLRIGRGTPDLYRVLQVDPRAEEEVIAAAYACLRQLYREGIWNGQADEEALDELTQAFSVLADREQRAAYDAKFPELRREEESTSETGPPSSLAPETASTDPEGVGHAFGRAAEPIVALASAVDWPALSRKVGRFLGRVLLAAGRAVRFTARYVYRGTRWFVIVVAAPGARRLMTAAGDYVDSFLNRRRRRPPARPSADLDDAVRERLHANSSSAASVIESSPCLTATEPSGHAAVPVARLVIHEGPHSGLAFIVSDRPISLGSDRQCDVVLEPQGKLVAPLHARIWYREGRFMLHQLAGNDESPMAGRRLTWGVLEDGDELRIGGHRLTFELGSPDRDLAAANEINENSSDTED